MIGAGGRVDHVAFVHLAQGIGATMRQIVEDLKSPRPDVRLARDQIRSMRQDLDRLDAELALRESAGLKADDIVPRVAQTYRAMNGWGESPVRVAAYFARILTATSHLAAGHEPVGHAFDTPDIEALRVAVRTQGVAVATLSWFAIVYPEHAVRIDQRSLDNLVTAFQCGAEGRTAGGRWPAIAATWKTCFGVHLSPTSIKNEIAKLPR
jgi:hypothetical protein